MMICGETLHYDFVFVTEELNHQMIVFSICCPLLRISCIQVVGTLPLSTSIIHVQHDHFSIGVRARVGSFCHLANKCYTAGVCIELCIDLNMSARWITIFAVNRHSGNPLQNMGRPGKPSRESATAFWKCTWAVYRSSGTDSTDSTDYPKT
jgi:hypothetical protein